MVESGETPLSSQFVQLPDTPTNFHRPSTPRSTKLAKSLKTFPQFPQRERIQYGYVIHVSRTFAYSIHQASFRFLHSKRFPRFPLQLQPTSTDLVGIWNKSSETWIPSKYQISLRSGHPFLSEKYLNFFKFSKLTPPPSSSKKNISVPIITITYLELVLILPIKFHPDLPTLSVFQDFCFPPLAPYVPGSNSSRKWSIWDIRSFYIYQVS